MEKNRVLLNDVCLREAAQVAGGAMSPEDQLTYVELLVKNGIDMIEIGFPASSEEHFRNCVRIVEFVKNLSFERKPKLSGLARGVETDISKVKEAGCDVCHIYIPVSDSLMLTQFDASRYGDTPEGKREWVIEQAKKAVVFARSIGFTDVEFSPEDAARTSLEYLARIVEAVIAAGATRVNIPDTTGLCVLDEFGNRIRYLCAKVENIQEAILSVHCHNDSDHATANALQAIHAGARQVEGTFYGLGERSGMTKFESVIMNVLTRSDAFGELEIGFNPKACVEAVNFVANALGMPAPRHWPVVGQQNGIVSSGTHMAIEVKAKEQGKGSAYYGWNPERFGHQGGVKLAVTQFSGKVGIAERLKELGFQLESGDLRKVTKKINQISAAKHGVSLKDHEITAIVEEVVQEVPNKIEVTEATVVGGKGSIPMAGVRIYAAGHNASESAIGNGPIDALMQATQKAAAKIYPMLSEVKIALDDWRPIPMTAGTEAIAEVYVRIRVENGGIQLFAARSLGVDSLQATAQAFAKCLSWLVTAKNK